jgi:antibiotic biosynthesis monooxygenase (ABM) superfamily enzyme
MAIVVFIAAYIISSLSRYILTPFIGQWPILGSAVIYAVILVISLTYFAMPIMSRLLRHWLYQRNYMTPAPHCIFH